MKSTRYSDILYFLCACVCVYINFISNTFDNSALVSGYYYFREENFKCNRYISKPSVWLSYMSTVCLLCSSNSCSISCYALKEIGMVPAYLQYTNFIFIYIHCIWMCEMIHNHSKHILNSKRTTDPTFSIFTSVFLVYCLAFGEGTFPCGKSTHIYIWAAPQFIRNCGERH